MREYIFTIVIILMLVMLSISLFFATTKSKNKLRIGIGSMITILIVISALRSILFGIYPDVKSTHQDGQNVARVYDPNESYQISDIRKWILVDNIGLVYFKEIRGLDGNQVRLFYRTVGIHDENLFDANIKFIDEDGSQYDLDRDGASASSGIILSAACVDFYNENEYVYEINSIKLNDTIIEF